MMGLVILSTICLKLDDREGQELVKAKGDRTLINRVQITELRLIYLNTILMQYIIDK